MKNILKLEELAMLPIALYFLTFHTLGLSWWVWCILFFAPDLGMLGYLVNSKADAFTYNLVHQKGIAIACIATGYFLKQEILVASGILLFAHSSFDRVMGYGLKYESHLMILTWVN